MSMANLHRPLILGSTSVYRRELLQRLRVPFEVVAPLVDETPWSQRVRQLWRSDWPWPKRVQWLNYTHKLW